MYWVSAPIVQPWEDTMDFCVYKPWLVHGSCFHSRICFLICLLVSFKLLLSSLQYAYNFQQKCLMCCTSEVSPKYKVQQNVVHSLWGFFSVFYTSTPLELFSSLIKLLFSNYALYALKLFFSPAVFLKAMNGNTTLCNWNKNMMCPFISGSILFRMCSFRR